MNPKDKPTPQNDKTNAMPFQPDRALALQKELVQSYGQANRAWLERVQSEAALWAELAAKLARTSSLPEAIEAYTHCVSQQIRMTAEDGKRLLDDSQQIARIMANLLPADGPRQRP
jgi:hypothetical protein